MAKIKGLIMTEVFFVFFMGFIGYQVIKSLFSPSGESLSYYSHDPGMFMYFDFDGDGFDGDGMWG